MTVSTVQIPEGSQVADGATDHFTLGFTVEDAAQLVVTVNGVATTAFDIVGNEIVLDAMPADGDVVAWRRATKLTQERAFSLGANVSPRVNEEAHDDAMRILQEQNAWLARALYRRVGGDHFDAANYRISDLAAGELASDAATFGQLQAVRDLLAAGAITADVVLPSRAALAAASVPAAFGSVLVLGYAVAGDAAAWAYRRVAAQPSNDASAVRSVDRYLPDGSSSDANGGWWQRVASIPTPMQFGATGDGVADDKTAIDAAVAYAASYLDRGHVDLQGRAYAYDGALASTELFANGIITAANRSFHYAAPRTVSAQPQAQHFWKAIRANQRDVYVFVGSDSTGNETSEWPYLTAGWFGEQAPTHSVVYRLWTDGVGWGAPVTVATGSGARTIYVDNCSVPGKNPNYLEGANEAAIFTDSRDYDLVVLSYGHNIGTNATEANALPEWMVAAQLVGAIAGRAGVFVTLQNPRRDTGGPEQSARVTTAWRKCADRLGLGVIDAYSAFQALADPASYYADTVHPNSAGMAVWLGAVQEALIEAPNLARSSGFGPVPAFPTLPNFALNPLFAAWDGAAPDNWAFTNCTPSKNPGRTEGGLYGVEIAITAGAGPKMTQDLSAALPRLRGRFVTLLMRVWRPTGLNSLGGRCAITASNGVTSTSATSAERPSLALDGWSWACVQLFIPRDSTSLTLTLFAGAADGSDDGKKLWVYSAWFGEGAMPGGVSRESEADKVIAELYSDLNVGQVAGHTGALTVAGGSIALAGATATLAQAYINVFGAIPGESYDLTWGDVSAVAGTVYVRNGLNGGSSNVASATFATETLTFTAPATAFSILIGPGSLVTDWELDSWSIVLTP